MKPNILFVILSLFLLSACSGSLSTLEGDARSSSLSVYPLTSEDADKVVIMAMTSQFSGGAISRVEYPNKGYQATMRFLLDSHDITAYMIPVIGLSNGVKTDGFAFEVNHSGTMAISGSNRADRVFKKIKEQAGLIANPIPFLSYKR